MQLNITRESLGRALGGLLLLALVAAVLVAVIRWIVPNDPFSGRIDEDRYQAVVLSDGRVFFGHLSSISDEYLELSEAYFVDQTEGTEEDPAVQRVVSITERVEGPDDAMLLNKEFVVAVENLRPDSDVVEAIEEVRAAGS